MIHLGGEALVGSPLVLLADASPPRRSSAAAAADLEGSGLKRRSRRAKGDSGEGSSHRQIAT